MLKICPLICIVSFFALEVYAATDKSSKVSIQAGQSCVTSECHATLGKDKFVHGPVASGDCTFCHEQDKKDQHVFQPIKNVEALCYACHDKSNTGFSGHKPAFKGKCIDCHDPHQSAKQFQFKDAPKDRTGGQSKMKNAAKVARYFCKKLKVEFPS